LAKRKHHGKRRQYQSAPRTSPGANKRESSEVRPSATDLSVRKRPDGMLEFVRPRCAIERDDDVREAQAMVAEGEIEVARDELRWLLQGCSDNLAIHVLLGEIALAEADYPLARGHFGYAYQIGQKALRRAGASGQLPAELPANRTFFTAGKGLVDSLVRLGKRELAEETVQSLLQCDPRDPLGLRASLTNETNRRAGP
jgi:hypothetical protein